MTVEELPARPVERRGRRADRAHTPIQQLPWSQPRLTLEPTRILSDDQLEVDPSPFDGSSRGHRHGCSPSRGARHLGAAGALVSGERVRIGRDIVDEALKTPPAEFTFYARNPEHNIQLGGNWIAFAPVGGPPNCSDADRGRRPGTLEDNANFIRLAQFFNCIHTAGGGSTDALDIHASVRHLHVMRSKVRHSDKVLFATSTGRARLFDSMEIARIARGVTPEQFLDQPSIYTVINTNSPLKLDGPMAMGIIETARHGQICCVTPFTLAGAMAPITVLGALVEQNAEALFGLALSQLSKPGAKFVYGGFTSNVDMKSGAPAFGTPEYMKACIIGGQLARRYKLPYRTSSTNAANMVDAQAAYESVFSLWGAIMGGGNLIQHAAGWMEGGLVGSFEKFALDVDLLQMVTEYPEAPRHERGRLRHRGDEGSRPGRALLRRPADAGAVYECLLCAAHLRLAEFPAVAGGGFAAGLAEGQRRLEAGACRICGAAARSGDRRGDRCLRRPPHRGGRREDRFLERSAFLQRPRDAVEHVEMQKVHRLIDGQRLRR